MCGVVVLDLDLDLVLVLVLIRGGWRGGREPEETPGRDRQGARPDGVFGAKGASDVLHP